VTPSLRTRKNARAILLNDFGEILLIQHTDTTPANPNNPEQLVYWVPPSGGVEEGDTYEQAAVRELNEETGISVKTVERCILERESDLLRFGELIRHREKFFLARISGRPTPVIDFANTGENISNARWWPLAEIGVSTETFFPEGLHQLMIEHAH
jgi:8-oxo-dGTP pyrophosphatase MutT (NUDIX family)